MQAIKVLIVDDAISQRLMLTSTLSHYQEIEVLGEAIDGEDSLSKFESLKPDIVIMDLVMPNMDGKEALRRIMEMDANAKIVIASSLGGKDDLEECLHLGAKSFVQKPYDEEDLVRTIKLISNQYEVITPPNTKFFGQFLLEKGIITREQLLKALEIQRQLSPLLGNIAIEKEWIEKKHAEKINIEQRRQDKRFGEIALSLSLLTEQQLEELLEEQRSRRKYFGEILVEQNYISQSTLNQQLQAHQQDNFEFGEQITSSLNKVQLRSQSRTINEAFIRFYQRMLKISISMSDIYQTLPAKGNNRLFWSQQISSDKNYRLVLSMDKAHACHIASQFLKIHAKAMDELTIDAIAEFLNTFTGQIYSRLGENTQPKVTSPQYHGDDIEVSLIPCTTLEFDSSQYKLTISIGVE